jgi:hypothetical protein
MAVNVNKIVYNFDDKWMRVLFHEPDFLEHCLLVALVKHIHSFLSPFDSKLFLVMLPDGSKNIGEATLSD